MSGELLSFDRVRNRTLAVLDGIELPDGMPEVFLVRSLYGRFSISVSERFRHDNDAVRDALNRLTESLQESLGVYSRVDGHAVLWVDDKLLDWVRRGAQEIRPGVFWVERLLAGEDWWTVTDAARNGGPTRYTLYGVKGGVGRTTTAVVMARHLANSGEDVLVVDLDLESPGLASAALPEASQPDFGVVDWFVEDLVEQSDPVLQQMVGQPAWAADLSGEVWMVPAHGSNPGEYLAKLGRVYMGGGPGKRWSGRLRRMLADLEDAFNPTVVVLESRSGLNDIAAATVTDIDARVLLFGVESPSTWTDYGILFDHWRDKGLAPIIRDRLAMVAGLTPWLEAERYLDRFHESAWNLFQDRLYDEQKGSGSPPEGVYHDLFAEEAPHNPMVIHWSLGLAAGTSLRRMNKTAVEHAYWEFLPRFDLLYGGRGAVETRPAVSVSDSVRITISASVSKALPTPEVLRVALSELPEETSHGSGSKPDELYLPPSHRKALDPNVMLVTGMRGSGKTYWWNALQHPATRQLLGRLEPRLTPIADCEIWAGFGVREAPELYAGRDELRTMLDETNARLAWRTIHARHLAGSDHPISTLNSWSERSRYVAENPGPVARLFHDRDLELDQRGAYSIALFDGLDRSADDWPTMFRLVRGLLEHALDMRSYRRLRAKAFLRSDQAAARHVANFPDASKVLSSARELTWPRRDLYGMLWQYLGNGSRGEIIRPWLAEGDWPTEDVGGLQVFRAPPHLTKDQDAQRKQFDFIAGPWMGTDRRRGFPFTWIPNHLGDAGGRVSPRSFIAALRKAAADTADRHANHAHALHYDSIKRGVQRASMIRVRELGEDYPWVDHVLKPLAGLTVPCGFEEIARAWTGGAVLDRLSAQIGQDEVKLPPRRIDQGPSGVREDLESLGVFRRLADGRVDLPDVFRIGYGLGRKGGVKPVK